MLTSLPLIAIAGAVSAQFLTKVSSKKLTSYGDAGDTVEQTIGAIRTVSSNFKPCQLFHSISTTL